MMMVFAFGISRPLSMIVVQTRTSIFPAMKSRHHAFQFVRIHLAVPDFNSGRRTKIDDPITHSLDGRYAIVQEEYLTLPFELAINRRANESLIVSRHDCFYGQAIERRRLNS